MHPACDGDLWHPEAETTAARSSSRCGNMKKKKKWLPNTQTTKHCSGSFKDIPRYLDYVSASRWIGCRNFCGNTGKCLKWTPYVSISSLVDTDQLSKRHKRRRELRSAQPRHVILCFILVMTYSSDKKCHSKIEDRFIPGDSHMIRRAAQASCIILASMWLTETWIVCGLWCHSVLFRLFP